MWKYQSKDLGMYFGVFLSVLCIPALNAAGIPSCSQNPTNYKISLSLELYTNSVWLIDLLSFLTLLVCAERIRMIPLAKWVSQKYFPAQTCRSGHETFFLKTMQNITSWTIQGSTTLCCLSIANFIVFCQPRPLRSTENRDGAQGSRALRSRRCRQAIQVSKKYNGKYDKESWIMFWL